MVVNLRRYSDPKGTDIGYLDKYLQPTFESGRFSVSFWAAITYGSHTPLIVVRKRTPEERTSEDDKLGMNAEQYTHEILEDCLIPFIYSLPGSPADYQTIEDGHKAHTSKLAGHCRSHYGITRMDWPPNSPDLNPIENVWSFLKDRI